ncbi:hypothetical protein [Dyadobacter fermentans]|uniref:hypothetical protein n=1 Tax=Dyadobacter fermentans TaxID=94254 RepID=UPI00019B5292|nr:hypothetical protein [Dyadobacter fermentans]
MALTFLRTCMASVGTYAAEVRAEPASQAHDFGGAATNGSAFQVKLDTFNQIFWITFFQAFGRTIAACHSTSRASVDTFFELLICHNTCG